MRFRILQIGVAAKQRIHPWIPVDQIASGILRARSPREPSR